MQVGGTHFKDLLSQIWGVRGEMEGAEMRPVLHAAVNPALPARGCD